MDFEDLTHRIIGCAMSVHNELGRGFQEVIYGRALALEFQDAGIDYEREKSMVIYFKNREIGVRRVDFFVEKTIMVEIKAVTDLDDVHLAQAKNYLEASHNENGLLLNFGAQSLQFKRLFNHKKNIN